MGSDHLEE